MPRLTSIAGEDGANMDPGGPSSGSMEGARHIRKELRVQVDQERGLGLELALVWGMEIRWMGTQRKGWEMRGGNQYNHAALPTRCASDREKQGLRWEWGRGSEFGTGQIPVVVSAGGS